MRSRWPALPASLVLHAGIAALAVALHRQTPAPRLVVATAVVDLEVPPPPPPAPTPVTPPPPAAATHAPPTPTPPQHPSAGHPGPTATPISVLTTEGGSEPGIVTAPPVPGAADAGVMVVPPQFRATSLLRGADTLSLGLAAQGPTAEEQRQQVRAVALAPILAALHANDHIDPPGTARAAAAMTTRMSEEIASRISVHALEPEVRRGPEITLPSFRPQESSGERMAGSELDALHSGSFTSVPFGPGTPACTSYHALQVDLAIGGGDAGSGVTVLRSSGNSSLDHSVVEVARELATEITPPGSTRWRFELADDTSPGRYCSGQGGWHPLANSRLRVRFWRLHGR